MTSACLILIKKKLPFKKLVIQLKLRMECEAADLSSKSKYFMLLQNIGDAEPFSAFGFYTVDRSTLTTALATITSNIIILIQFNLCNE